jgi:16S rRNA (uracil1498-N3)-methyltransferase
VKTHQNKKPPRVLLFDGLPRQNAPKVSIPEDEARHLSSVLRLKDGDPIEGLDGKGNHSLLRLQYEGKKLVAHFLSPLEPEVASAPQTLPIVLHIGVPKGEAMEWVCEKATELGVLAIQPWVTAHTVVDPLSKGVEKFQGRWQTLSDQALKQCGRLKRLTVYPPKKLSASTAPQKKPGQIGFFLDEIETQSAFSESELLPRLLHAPLQTLSLENPLQLWVGPEGGWSDEERSFLPRNLGLERASLGHLVLRAETAAIAAMSLATSALRNRR